MRIIGILFEKKSPRWLEPTGDFRLASSYSTKATAHQRDDEQDDCCNENEFTDSRCGSGQSAESEKCCDEGYDEKSECPVKHMIDSP